MSRGIDISHHNTCTNYAAAKAAVDWVYIKVTEGATYVDPAAGTHYAGFAGKPRGAYHFMRGSSPAEVANFVKQVRARQWELPPMLDAEYEGVTGGAIKAFLAEYQRQTGEELRVVYSSKSLFQGACNPATFITPRTILWAARYYQNNPTFSTLGWDHPQLGVYQYWDAGSVPGFTAGIDVDIARVDFAQTAPTPPVTHATNQEDMMAQGAAGKSQVSIPTNGARSLFCLIGGAGAKVTGHVYYIADTPPGTNLGRYLGDREVTFDADRPGPVGLPEGVRGITFFYDANAPFTAWCA